MPLHIDDNLTMLADEYQMIGETSQTNKKFLAIMSVIAFLFIMAGLVYVGVRLNNIEEDLQTLSISSTSQTVYVPAYSHVYSHEGLPYLLEVTLSIRNTDSTAGLTLTSVDYYDTEGKLIRKYIKDPRRLKVLESVSFIVEMSDYQGGSGANFIVKWNADKPINKPVIEALMIGINPKYQISFVRPGIPIK